jgi:hypothetical protein
MIEITVNNTTETFSDIEEAIDYFGVLIDDFNAEVFGPESESQLFDYSDMEQLVANYDDKH